ncbi:MAG: flagellar type III secretion system protein FliR [Rhodospirillaceae bacterium]|nr:flagellar type III secretion system protein FliR [Rhodospirillales bacterium]
MLNEILTLDIYRFFMIFSRLSAALMLFPAFGGRLVSTRIRLLFALALSLLLLPVVGTQFPPLPRHVGGLILLIGSEALIGLYLGVVTQVLMSSLNIAGTFIGFQIGLTNAFSFDAVAEQQSSTLTALLANIALLAILATDMHHLMLRALADSYATFIPGQALPLDDFSETLGHLMSASFGFGIQAAAPILAFGLIFNVGLGLLSRLAPQIQVFFVGLPLQVIAGLWMLMVALPLIVMSFLRWYEAGLMPFVR